MRYRASILPFLLLPFVLGACSTFRGEPATLGDAPPPSGYAPIYLKKVAAVTPAADPAIQVSRIDATQPNRVRVYLHLFDENGTYLSGASGAKWKSWWCGIEETIGGETRQITKYTLREVTENDRQPHAIALVMDHSGSMGEDRALAVQNAADMFVGLKKPEDAVALIKYDNRVGLESALTGDAGTLRSKLPKIGLQGYGGLTAIADGVGEGIRQVSTAESARRRAVIVFTDGEDNSSSMNRDSMIALARRNNVMVCAVDFGYGVNEDYLAEVARQTGGSYHQMYSTSEFANVFEDIYRRLRNYYVLEYSPVEYGIHQIRLKICTGKDSAVTRAAFDNTPDIGTIALLNVFFDVNKSQITTASKPALDNIHTLMKAVPTLSIEVRGHTDNTNSTGDPNYNMTLSQRRADAVRDELVRRGIAGDRIRSVGFGETMPVAENTSEEGKAQNRRTEFVIVGR